MKILITGNAGSGKSTLAQQLSRQYDIPYYSLDGIVWKPGWQKTPIEERRQKIQEILATNDWVIDGVDMDVLGAADKVIFLDIPRKTCYRNALNRNYKYLFKPRPELPAHCPEILIIPKLVKIIWRFPARIRPLILDGTNRRDDAELLHIRRYSELSHPFILH